MGIEGEFLVANITWKHDGLLLVLAPRINNVVNLSNNNNFLLLTYDVASPKGGR